MTLADKRFSRKDATDRSTWQPQRSGNEKRFRLTEALRQLAKPNRRSNGGKGAFWFSYAEELDTPNPTSILGPVWKVAMSSSSSGAASINARSGPSAARENRVVGASGDDFPIGEDKCGDNGTRELLERILKMEEGHIDWGEIQRDQIEQMGLANYLTNQSE